MGVELPILVALVAAAFLAGFVDAVAGGGGLILMPSLLAALGPRGLSFGPGTNKVASICGTSAALGRYARHGSVRWARLAIAGPLVFLASMSAAWGYLEMLKDGARYVKPAFAVCFVALSTQQAWKTLRGPRESATPTPRPFLGLFFLVLIGLYDGLVGPGTGIFFFWAFTTWFALPALEGTGTTKAANWLTNAGALTMFIARGKVIWPLALSMAGANLCGGWLGAHTAIRRGVRFIRLTTAVVSIGASIYLLVT